MTAKVLSPTPENLRVAAQALQAGKVVGMPTETVYGLAGSAFDPVALARIFETKERPTFDPLIVHLAPASITATGLAGTAALARIGLVDLSRLNPLARERADRLIERFWPGPLTLVLPKDARVPELATSGLPSVGIRMPHHPVAQALIAQAGVPLAAPSANRFGRISPTSAADVLSELGNRIEWILDGGPCEIGVESTVLSIGEDGAIVLLRPGGVPRAEIEAFLGLRMSAPATAKAPVPATGEPASGLSAPGMLESHYAPEKPLILLPGPAMRVAAQEFATLARESFAAAGLGAVTRIGLLLLAGPASPARKKWEALTGKKIVARSLSEKGDLAEVAQNLFAGLREMDAHPVEAIFVEPSPSDEGLGHAIADRLRRASAKRPGKSE